MKTCKSTLQTVTDWIKKNQRYWETDGPIFAFAICEKQSNQLIGMIEANTDRTKIPELEQGDANISYMLYPKARGKGYMAHAMSLMLEFLKQKGVKRAIIRVKPENIKSVNVAKRYGFQYERNYLNKDQHKFDTYIRVLS